ncbi:hypothetical protein LPJ70_007887, partial [Coemansia sp. RSA 2708]
LSVSGGHECEPHAGHVWPSQISPSATRDNSRAPSPTRDARLAINTADVHASHSFPGRSDPRNGSPVYLSAGDYAASFAMHRMTGEPLQAQQSQQSQSEPGHLAAQKPRLANQKIDSLHVAGHGSVDVVETTPTITLRYSSNVPADVRKQTAALKNELVGIEEDSSDSSSERGSKPPQ